MSPANKTEPGQSANRGGGTLLLALGLLSFFLGPLTAIPGIIVSKRFRPFSGTAMCGFVLCWFALVIYVIAFVAILLATRR